MQSELEELKSNNPKKELAEIKELVLKLTSDLGELKKSRGDVDGIDAGIQQVGERLAQVEQVMAGVSDDAKMGEMNESEPQITQTTQVQTTQVEIQTKGEFNEDKLMISSLFKRKGSDVMGERPLKKKKISSDKISNIKERVIERIALGLDIDEDTGFSDQLFDSDEECDQDDIIPDKDYDKDYGGEGIVVKITKSGKAESEHPKESKSESQTQTEKSQTQKDEVAEVYKRSKKKKETATQTNRIGIKEYTNVVELPSITKPTNLIILGDSPQLPEDRFVAQILKYEGKGKKPAYSKDEIKTMVKEMIDASKSEEVYEEGIKIGAQEAGMTVEEYKKHVTKTLDKMGEWVGGTEHLSMKVSTSGTRGLKYGCDRNTLPLKLIYLINDVIDTEEEDPRNVTSRSFIEYPGFGIKTYESEADQVMNEKIRIEKERIDNIQQLFKEKAWKSSIISLDYSESEQGLLLICIVKDKKRITFPFSKLVKLGLTEWIKIASLSEKIQDMEIRRKIKTEVIYMVHAAFQLGYVSVPKYQVFCSENNVILKSRSLGLDTTTEGINAHPVPQGIIFIDRMYVKTEDFEGLCYKDPIDEECFQDINTIHRMSLHHCLALLRECEDQQCLPFRKRLISWLFNNLLQVKKMKGTKRNVELILREYQEMFKQTDEDMKKLIKWKIERLKLFKNQS